MRLARLLVVGLLLVPIVALAQTAVLPYMSPHQQFFDSNGKPIWGGKIYTYHAGTTTKYDTWADSLGVAKNPNPIVLDAGGFAQEIWLGPEAYKFVAEDRNGVLLWTVDNVKWPAGFMGGRINIQKNGIYVGTRPTLNFIEGSNIGILAADENAADRVNLTFSVAAPTLQTGMETYIAPPISGQYAVIYPSSSSVHTQLPYHAGVANDTSGVLTRYTSSSLNGGLAWLEWSGFSLPSEVIPTNITAVYAVMVADHFSGSDGNSGNVYMNCGLGEYTASQAGDTYSGSSTYTVSGALQGNFPLAQYNSTTLPFASNIASVRCAVKDSSTLNWSGGNSPTHINAVALVVYYTGTPIVNNKLKIYPPLSYNLAENSLAVSGLSKTVVVKGSDGANCNIVLKSGVITTTTCP